MKILILEDNPVRVRKFKIWLIGHLVEHVSDANTCKERLATQTWDYLFLDHDLDGRVYIDSAEANTGYQVAKWLSNNKDRMPKCIIVHTLNLSGAICVQKVIPCIYIPFPHLITQTFEDLIKVI